MSADKFLYGNGKDRLLGTSSAIDLDDAETIATSKAVYELNKKIEVTGKLPLGHFFLHPFPTPPDGCLVVNGGEYNRELYKDLWADVQIKGQYKTEAEWQQIASENGGYCSWYSDGDGSTTFRVPKFAPYQKIAIVSGDAGKYYSAGLPNIEGTFTGMDGATSGAFKSLNGNIKFKLETSGIRTPYQFDASLSNSIYGNSTTVTPESHDWIVCVVAYGKATNVGEVDVANVMSAVNQVQEGLENKVNPNQIPNYSAPDWNRVVRMDIGTNSAIQVPANGFFKILISPGTNGYCYIHSSLSPTDFTDSTKKYIWAANGNGFSFAGMIPVQKGIYLKRESSTINNFESYFIPAVGEEWNE